MTNKPSTDKEIVAAFDTLFNEISIPTEEDEIDQELREAGYDPDAIAQQMAALAAAALADSPYNWRRRAQDAIQVEKAAREAFSITPPRERPALISAIRNLVTSTGGNAMAAYRNLEEVSDEDLQTLLADLKFLAEKQERS